MTDTAPSAAGPLCARLAGELRDLRTRTGLSMVALAERTAYSKSSWERYLNGRQLAPRQAVEALCTVAREPSGRLVALWELADLEWSGRANTTAPPMARAAATPSPDDRPGDHGTSTGHTAPGRGHIRSIRRHQGVLVATCAVGLTAAIAVTALLHTATENPTKTASSARPAPGCHAQTCTGHKPTAKGCAMPRQEEILREQKLSTGTPLEVVYSKQCRAAWALVGTAQVGDVLSVSTPGGASEHVKVTDKYDAESPLVTPMIDGSGLTGLRACFTPADGHKQCFQT
ncbi:helix-turn-helix domain-containing protein [Streptomyces sp. NPDC048417]|uniref:helix-turn-helix domain-containing protein n=1 Tax=Streptomyces sp. NPDC048417 TaxID=3155387 RepID=UPI00342E7B6D